MLRAGEPIGYDIIVITNGPELTELMESEWLIPLDHRYLDNFRLHASDLASDPPWDPGTRYTVAWQSGLTGIAYGPEAVEALGREPQSIQDLWNPALRGKVGMMSDPTELGSVGLLGVGVDPVDSTPEDWRRAADWLWVQKRNVRPRYYDQVPRRAGSRGHVDHARLVGGHLPDQQPRASGVQVRRAR